MGMSKISHLAMNLAAKKHKNVQETTFNAEKLPPRRAVSRPLGGKLEEKSFFS
jgi:hypothetical protein